MLPVYIQDGIILSRVFHGSTDNYMFEDFIQTTSYTHHLILEDIPNQRLLRKI